MADLREVHSIPFDGTEFYLSEFNHLPLVAVDPICYRLAIDVDWEVSRLCEEQLSSGLRLKRGRWASQQEDWALLALEDLSWWLRTVEGVPEKNLEMLLRWRQRLPWALIEAWYRARRRQSKHAMEKKRLAKLHELPDHKHGSRFTTLQIETAKTLIGKGYSQAEAAAHVGMSPASLSLLLRGKYPAKLKDSV